MRLPHWLALVTLCLVSGSRWLLGEDLPLTLAQEAVHFLVFAGLFAVISHKIPKHPFEIAFLAVLLLAFPLAAFAQAEGHITAFTQTVVFTFVPVVAVFVTAQQRQTFGPDPGTRALLIPSLAGVVGVLFLIPVTLPTSPVNVLRLIFIVGAMLSASTAAIRLHRVLAGTSVFTAAAVVSAACGATLALLGFHQPISLLPRDFVALVLDGGALLLTLYLLRELHPIRASTRFLLIPLLTILEGLLLLRPRITVDMFAGLILLGYACAALLRSGDRETV